MKYLKKEMVKRVIELAKACPVNRQYTPEEIALATKGRLPEEPELQAFNKYLSDIGTKATAELTALMWLGQDQRKKPSEFNELFETAMGPRVNDVYKVPKQRIGSYLRTGMERLIRASKLEKQFNESGRIILAKGQLDPATPPINAADPSLDEKRALIAGKFVLASFREQYGNQALDKLAVLLLSKGFLKDPAERALFVEDTTDVQHKLESVLGMNPKKN